MFQSKQAIAFKILKAELEGICLIAYSAALEHSIQVGHMRNVNSGTLVMLLKLRQKLE